jgi:hypothetical protein
MSGVTHCSPATITAAAPSLREEAFAAVTVPSFLNAGCDDDNGADGDDDDNGDDGDDDDDDDDNDNDNDDDNDGNDDSDYNYNDSDGNDCNTI